MAYSELYGYVIQNGKAEVRTEEAGRILRLFEAYIQGMSLIDCVRVSGIPRSPQTCRRMLGNRTYLGDEFYPGIVSDELFAMAARESEDRQRFRITPHHTKRRIRLPVYTEFVWEEAVYDGTPEDPQSAATRLYGCIRIKSKSVKESETDTI